MNIREQLKDSILVILKEFDPTLTKSDIVIEYPADTKHGDLATTIALSLFGKLKTKQAPEFPYASPREFAQKIADKLLNENLDYIETISVAGPGFINFTFSDAFLLSKMGLVVQQRGIVVEHSLSDEKVMVEFTDPNPFKELHIGHLYSNTVGEAISRLHEALGATVSRACYQGDVGMHVAKSIWGMKALFAQQFPDKTVDEALELLESQSLAERVNFLGKAYAAGATAYQGKEEAAQEKVAIADQGSAPNQENEPTQEINPDQKAMKNINYLVFIAAQENLKESTNFQPQVDYQQFVPGFTLDSPEFLEVLKLYRAGRTWSLDYFNQMYARIGMNFNEFFFESLVGEYGYQIVQDHLKQGVFEKSNGAIIFPGSKYGLHDRVFINSLGLPTYEAKELGLAPEKYRRFPYDTSIVITGNEIDEYFKVLLQALKLTNPELREKTFHKSHGMVRLPEGKMSSRTGKVVTAQWLIDEAVQKIKTHMQEHRPELGPQEIETISESVGLGAIKYAFLKQSVGKDITFSFEESLSFTGNSGPYMQYSYVRCVSVLEKAQNEVLNELSLRENSGEQRPLDSVPLQTSQVQGKKHNHNAVQNQDALNTIANYFDTLLNNKEYLKSKLNDDEKQLLRNIYRYSDIVAVSAQEFAPHTLTNYLYELAQSFNVFYANHTILAENEETTKLRLVLVAAVAYTIQHGLEILGITTVEKM